MSNTYHQVYIQAVFAVKYREAVITNECKSKILSIIGNLINETGCKTIIVNGTEDHVHCFLGLKPTASISELMKIVKGKSSKYINDNQLQNLNSNGRRVMVFFPIANLTLMPFINILPIKNSIIKNKILKMNIYLFWINSMSNLMKDMFLKI
jgi:REP element-mobilizing transposase RayT